MIYAVEVHNGRTMSVEIVAGDTVDAANNAALARHPAGSVTKGTYPATHEQIKGAGDTLGGPKSLDEAMDLNTRAEFEQAAVDMGIVLPPGSTDVMVQVAVLEQVALRRGGKFDVKIGKAKVGGAGGGDNEALKAALDRVAELEGENASLSSSYAELSADFEALSGRLAAAAPEGGENTDEPDPPAADPPKGGKK